MKPVIFLDMDGVLCTQRSHHAFARDLMWRHLDPVGVGLLERLVEENKALLVCSSTWRVHYNKSAMTTMLSIGGMRKVPWHDDWQTPNFSTGARGTEIAHWLKMNGEPPYLILDDDLDMLPEQKPFFVHTHEHDGFLWEHYVKAEKILRGAK